MNSGSLRSRFSVLASCFSVPASCFSVPNARCSGPEASSACPDRCFSVRHASCALTRPYWQFRRHAGQRPNAEERSPRSTAEQNRAAEPSCSPAASSKTRRPSRPQQRLGGLQGSSCGLTRRSPRLLRRSRGLRRRSLRSTSRSTARRWSPSQSQWPAHRPLEDARRQRPISNFSVRGSDRSTMYSGRPRASSRARQRYSPRTPIITS